MKVKSKIFVIIVVMCVVFGVTAVIASDGQSGVDSVSNKQFDFDIGEWISNMMGTDGKSFGDLFKEMGKCNTTFDMKMIISTAKAITNRLSTAFKTIL